MGFENNITHPTDTKLVHNIIRRCWKLADRNGIKMCRRYRKAVRQCVLAQRWRKDPKKRKAAHRALRKLKVVAGRLIRELERKLPATSLSEERANFALYRRVLRQQPGDRNKIYSLHEPQVYCLRKGKEQHQTREDVEDVLGLRQTRHFHLEDHGIDQGIERKEQEGTNHDPR